MNWRLPVAPCSARAVGADADRSGAPCEGLRPLSPPPIEVPNFLLNTLAVVLEGGLDPRYSVPMREASPALSSCFDIDGVSQRYPSAQHRGRAYRLLT